MDCIEFKKALEKIKSKNVPESVLEEMSHHCESCPKCSIEEQKHLEFIEKIKPYAWIALTTYGNTRLGILSHQERFQRLITRMKKEGVFFQKQIFEIILKRSLEFIEQIPDSLFPPSPLAAKGRVSDQTIFEINLTGIEKIFPYGLETRTWCDDKSNLTILELYGFDPSLTERTGILMTLPRTIIKKIFNITKESLEEIECHLQEFFEKKDSNVNIIQYLLNNSLSINSRLVSENNRVVLRLTLTEKESEIMFSENNWLVLIVG